VHIREARHQNADQIRPPCAELAQQFDAIVTGQALIHQHQVEIVRGEQPARLLAVLSQADAGGLGQQPFEQDAGAAVVIDDENFGQHVSQGGAGCGTSRVRSGTR